MLSETDALLLLLRFARLHMQRFALILRQISSSQCVKCLMFAMLVGCGSCVVLLMPLMKDKLDSQVFQ